MLMVIKPDQITDNVKALGVLPKLTDEIMEKIEKILDNSPSPEVRLCPWPSRTFPAHGSVVAHLRAQGR